MKANPRAIRDFKMFIEGAENVLLLAVTGWDLWHGMTPPALNNLSMEESFIANDASMAINDTSMVINDTSLVANRATTAASRESLSIARLEQDIADGCFNSFTADTLVATDDGEKPIGEISLGDTVLAYDEESGETEHDQIVATITHIDPSFLDVVVDGELIHTTEQHPFYTLERGWTDAGDLQRGDHIRKADSDYGVVQHVGVVQIAKRMYNLTVQHAHTFFVGKKRWLVHNLNPNCQSVKPEMRLLDEAEPNLIVDGIYQKNLTAQNINDLIYKGKLKTVVRNSDGSVASEMPLNGTYMYVIDDASNITLATRNNRSRLPHPTLIGGADPQAQAAGIIDIRGGRIYLIDNASGHYQSQNSSLDIAKQFFDRLQPSVFHPSFQGYLPWDR